MSIATDSISRAARIGQIGFPEFTAKLITDVFNALISANMTQQQAYIELVKQVSKGLRQYVVDNMNQVSGSDILNFLVKVAPDALGQYGDSGTIVSQNNANSFTAEEASRVNNSLLVEGLATNTAVANTTSLISELYTPILNATAIKITADKYTLLEDLIKQGILRLVVNSGEISTSLNFEARESTFYERQSSKFNRTQFDFASNVSGGTAFAAIANIAASTNYSRVGVSTVQSNTNASSSTLVQITGAVKLSFSTDYQPLNQLTQNRVTTPTLPQNEPIPVQGETPVF